MGFILFALFSVLEVALAIWTCTKAREKRMWRKKRLILCAAQIVIVVIALLLPFGQKWRFVPVLGFLAVLLVIEGLITLIKLNKEDGTKKPAAAIVSCVLCVLLLGLLLAPAFLFTGYNGLPVSGKYQIGEVCTILIDKSRTDPFEQDGSFREVPVHFYYPVIGETDAEQFPLVVFSHGAFGYYQSNTSTYMELASNGYVIVALDHPHHAFFTEDTDGKTVIVDMNFINTAMNLNDKTDPQEQYELYTQWMALRTADMNFVLDELNAAGQTRATNGSWCISDNDGESIRSVLRMTDFSKIGVMGHSMGGATSVALGRERDDVTAVIDLDGTMLSEYTGVVDGKFTVNEEPYEVPVLEFVNWETYNELAEFMEEYRAEGGRYPNDELMRHAATGFTTTIRDTKHMDFTDLPLLSPFLGNILGSGERSTEETMTVVNSLVLSFFDCYLKGEGVFTVQDSY